MSALVSGVIRRPIRVLVVDDDPAVRDAYGQILLDKAPSAGSEAQREMRAKLFPGASGVATAATPAGSSTRFEVSIRDCAEAAVATVRESVESENPYAVVFLDMRMPPGRDGAWAAEQIRALDNDIEIVVCSAYSDVDPALMGQRVPPEDKLLYLQKPFHPHEVRQMATALGQKWHAERHVTRLAYNDELTGLPNRAWFQQRLSAAIETARQQRQQLGLIYLDLDNFKRVNDTLGHGVGDQLLRQTADRISVLLRRDDCVARSATPVGSSPGMARLGGDEFVVLLHDLKDPADIGAIAARLLQTLSQPMQLDAHRVLVSPSIGIAVYPADGDNVEALFRNADLAMYFGKRRGPGQVTHFREAMSAGSLKRLTIESELRGAIERDQLSLHYQPQFELSTGELSGLEALLRWSSDVLGPVSPDEFIPVAEMTGLILPIGEWVLRTACRQVKAWREEGLVIPRVSVNVSGMQFAQADFPSLVAAALREYGLPPAVLELEITESLLIRDAARSQQILAELKHLGVSVAIDDFGTGYSSLSRLREFACDRLKIDRAFVRDLHLSPDDRAVVSAIIKMAQTLGLKVVAEGVEELTHLLHLQEEFCNEAQGYLLSHPLPAHEARTLLQRAATNQESGRTERLRKIMS